MNRIAEMVIWDDKKTPINAKNLNPIRDNIIKNTEDILNLQELKFDKVTLTDNSLKFFANDVEKYNITLPIGNNSSFDLSAYQTKTDENLNTKNKEIVEAINEIASDVSQIPTKLDGKRFKYLTQAEYDLLDVKEKDVVYCITDYNALEEYDDTELRDKINGKVDRDGAKGLTTNDFTNEYKAKIDRLTNTSLELNSPDGSTWLISIDNEGNLSSSKKS